MKPWAKTHIRGSDDGKGHHWCHEARCDGECVCDTDEETSELRGDIQMVDHVARLCKPSKGHGQRQPSDGHSGLCRVTGSHHECRRTNQTCNKTRNPSRQLGQSTTPRRDSCQHYTAFLSIWHPSTTTSLSAPPDHIPINTNISTFLGITTNHKCFLADQFSHRQCWTASLSLSLTTNELCSSRQAAHQWAPPHPEQCMGLQQTCHSALKTKTWMSRDSLVLQWQEKHKLHWQVDKHMHTIE